MFDEMEEYIFINYDYSKVFLRSKQDLIAFPQWKNMLQNYYENSRFVFIHKIDFNQMYCAYITNEFQRVIVKKMKNPSLCAFEQRSVCKAQSVDYGKISEIYQDCLQPLPPVFQDISPFISAFYLMNVDFYGNKYLKILKWLKKRLENKTLRVEKIHSRVEKDSREVKVFVNLYEGPNLINREVVDMKFGIWNTLSSIKSLQDPLWQPKAAEQRNEKPMSWKAVEQRNENNDSSLMSIPFPNIRTTPPKIIGKTPEIYPRKDEFKDYADQCHTQNLSSYLTKLEMMSLKLKEVGERRIVLQPYTSDGSILMQAIHHLFEDSTFHALFDDLIQQGMDCQVLLDSEKKISIDKIKRFEEVILPIDIEQKASFIRGHRMRLEIQVLDWEDAQQSCVLPGCSSPYTRMGNEYLIWKNEYLTSQTTSNEKVEAVATRTQQHSSFLRTFFQERDKELPLGWDGMLKELSVALDEEELLSAKGSSSLPVTCRSVLQELALRLSKLNKIRDYSNALRGVEPRQIIETITCLTLAQEVPEPPQHHSLLHLVERSASIRPQVKCLVIIDLVEALGELHSRGQCYGLLTPQNVLIGDRASLCPFNRVLFYEPLPPFKFLAPECSIDTKTQPPGPPVDCYSVGQLIMWLYSLEGEGDFVDLLTEVQERNPLLKALTLRDPERRPSIKVLIEHLPKMLLNIFALPVDKNEELNMWWEQSPFLSPSLGGVVAAPIMGVGALEEEEQIRKEMIDSSQDASSDDCGFYEALFGKEPPAFLELEETAALQKGGSVFSQ